MSEMKGGAFTMRNKCYRTKIDGFGEYRAGFLVTSARFTVTDISPGRKPPAFKKLLRHKTTTKFPLHQRSCGRIVSLTSGGVLVSTRHWNR